jgi:acylphosphatase
VHTRDVAAVRVRIEGRVQGVGFRAFAVREALVLGITGEVWNTYDEAVEAVAFHDSQDSLDSFVDALWSGPGYVEDVTSEPIELDEPPAEFVVGPRR